MRDNSQPFAEGKLQKHFQKHVLERMEWNKTEISTIEEYLKRAQDLLNAPTGASIEGFVSKNGFTFRYNKVTNEFATAKSNCIIETFFKPKDGMNYWLDQISKYKE